MTICVGILCTDGVIIASDTMLSNNILGMNNRKIYQLPFGVCGIAGSDSLGKYFIHALGNFPIIVSPADPYQFTSIISEVVKQQIYQSNPGIQGNINAMLLNSMQRNDLSVFVNFCAMLGFTMNNNFYLANFQAAEHSLFGASITKADDKVFWKIIGSGYSTSAPLVKLLCDILQITDKPNLKQGKILAYWLVKYAIDNSSQFVGGNVDILQLTNNHGEPTTTSIDFSECESLRSAIMAHIGLYYQPATENPKIPTL
jgi:hypothetical protein